MKKKRTMRMLYGTAGLVALALVMGWFVGQYIPGEPKNPEPEPSADRIKEDARTASNVVSVEPGTVASLTQVTQGDAYLLTDDDFSQLEDPDSYKEALKRDGLWQVTYPDIDVAVKDARAISLSSLAEWYPHYPRFEKPIEEGMMIIVTLEIANASSETIRGSISPLRGALPMITLAGASINASHDSLRAGLSVDAEAFFLLNEQAIVKNILPGEETTADVFLEPSQKQELVMPFLLTRADLEDSANLDITDLTGYCLQTPDYLTSTLYRLWLK